MEQDCLLTGFLFNFSPTKMSTLTPPKPFKEWLKENREDLRDDWIENGDYQEDGWEGFDAWSKIKYDNEILLYKRITNR